MPSRLGEWGWALLDGYNLFVLAYFFILSVTYVAMTLIAFRSLRKHALRQKSVYLEDLIRSSASPPVTLIAPAYNEGATCVDVVRALLGMEYPSFQVLVVNDGSTDETLPRLKEKFKLDPAPRFPVAEIPTASIRGVWHNTAYPDLWVIDKENGGKADALNAGLNYCRTPLFCAMDADSLPERDALTRLARAFMENVFMVAVGGIVRIANGCTFRSGTLLEARLPKSLLARFQVLEYLRAFLSGRMGWDAIRATLIISGAFGMFRRSAVVAAGGFLTETVGEDMELVVRLHRHFREKRQPYDIGFVPDPVAWTEAPESFRQLGHQRDRWQRGLIESLMRHRCMLLNPRYGRIGLLAFPYYFFLEMIGPVIEVVGYVTFATAVVFGRASLPYMLAFVALASVLGVALSIAAVGLEELTFRRYPRMRDLVHLFALAVIENIGYRQMISFWRLRGIVSKARGVKTWGEMERTGFRSAEGAT